MPQKLNGLTYRLKHFILEQNECNRCTSFFFFSRIAGKVDYDIILNIRLPKHIYVYIKFQFKLIKKCLLTCNYENYDKINSLNTENQAIFFSAFSKDTSKFTRGGCCQSFFFSELDLLEHQNASSSNKERKKKMLFFLNVRRNVPNMYPFLIQKNVCHQGHGAILFGRRPLPLFLWVTVTTTRLWWLHWWKKGGGVFDQPPFSNSNRTCSFWIPSLTPGMCMWFCDLPRMALRSLLWIVSLSLPFLAIYQFHRKVICNKPILNYELI